MDSGIFKSIRKTILNLTEDLSATKIKIMTITVPEETKAILKLLADAANLSLEKYVEKILTEGWQKELLRNYAEIQYEEHSSSIYFSSTIAKEEWVNNCIDDAERAINQGRGSWEGIEEFIKNHQ